MRDGAAYTLGFDKCTLAVEKMRRRSAEAVKTGGNGHCKNSGYGCHAM